MTKRLLDANASDFVTMTPRQIVEGIRLSEGRIVAAEINAAAPPLIDKVSNPELAASMGADLVLLNFYDVTAPQVFGFPNENSPSESKIFGRFPFGLGVTINQVKAWIGRPVGLNLEPIEDPEALTSSGRLATVENARLALEQGADFLAITGNPHTGVTMQGICRSAAAIRAALGDRIAIFAGKMHTAGVSGAAMDAEEIRRLAGDGADGILLPAPGTVPGMTVEAARALIEVAHSLNLLAMNTVGTSQEGASISTIEQLALWSKMSGADIHHLGDAGTLGIAVPENIYAWSMALRGRRHTWHRMASSLRR
ncbi:MAG: haloacid dehalogenase-like hydrolase [Chloroflexi bacterium]|jgi:hypothetical protein|nr:haloacid dehalogenase-like hydrolase [Chloroflexota bacterium]